MKGMSDEEALREGSYSDFEEYNRLLDTDYKYWKGEAKKYILPTIKKWIAIRDYYTYTEDSSGNNWQYIDIRERHTRLGANYIYIDPVRRLWRFKTRYDRDGNPEELGEPFEF